MGTQPDEGAVENRAMRNLILFVVLLGAACTKPNPNRCCTDPADCQANNIPVGNTCQDGLVCRGNQCIAETCMASSDCESLAPYCVSGLCGASCNDDTQCPGAAQDPSDRFCVSGACVACRAGMNDCPADAPVCDAGACRACAADSDCTTGLCDLDAGTCVPASAITYASPSGGDAAACTGTDPCSLKHALAVAAVDQSRSNVKLAQGTYTTIVTLMGPSSVTVFGEGAVIDAQFLVQDGFTLRFRDLTFSDAGQVQCQPSTVGGPIATLDLARVAWPGNVPTEAIIGDPCKINLRQVRMRSTTLGSNFVYASGEISGSGGATANRGSIVTADQCLFDGGDPAFNLTNFSALQLTNSVLMNERPLTGAIGVDTTYPANSSVSFSTFYNTTWTCANGTPYVSSSNNIFENERTDAPADTVSGTACTHNYDLIKRQSTSPSGANNVLGMDPRFSNPAAGDFHLLPGSPAIDAADPSATDSVDFDGTTRPQGAKRDIGAFEYKP